MGEYLEISCLWKNLLIDTTDGLAAQKNHTLNYQVLLTTIVVRVDCNHTTGRQHGHSYTGNWLHTLASPTFKESKCIKFISDKPLT